MQRFWALSLLLLASIAFLTLACGSGRHLQSISISQTVNGQQVQLVATGTYSAPPTTVTPLPVNWSGGLLAPPPRGNLQYSLSNQPFVVACGSSIPSGQPFQFTALAPSNPNAPTAGSLPLHDLVTTLAAGTCP
jgi:hypothetical protein